METVNSLTNYSAIPHTFDPIHNVGVFVRVKLFRNLDVSNKVPPNKRIMSSPTQTKTYLRDKALKLDEAPVQKMRKNVNVYAPNCTNIFSYTFFSPLEPVLAKNDVTVGKQEPLSLNFSNAFFPGACSGAIDTENFYVAMESVCLVHDLKVSIGAEAVNDDQAIYGNILVDAFQALFQ